MPVAFIFFREKVRPFPHLAKRVNNKGRAVAEAFGNHLLAEVEEEVEVIVRRRGCNTNQKDSGNWERNGEKVAGRKYKSDIKDRKISVKLSEGEYDKLCDDAKESGLTISGYIRELISGGGRVDISYADDRAKLIRQIVGIATNVNQLARKVNELGRAYYSDVLRMQDYLKEVQNAMREVLKAWQSQKS
jgi:effector-binding domain-containing protein